jgi:predicted Zn-dependent protease
MIFLMALWMAATAPTAFDRLAKEAAAAREGNNFEQALTLYRKAVRVRPAWAEGWWYLGAILYNKDNCVEAKPALGRFTSLDPKAGPGHALLGVCEYQARNYEKALVHLEQGEALGYRGNEQVASAARYHLALLLTRNGQFERALQVLFGFVSPNVPQRTETPAMIEALGLASLRLAVLPHELTSDKREVVYRAGRAVLYAAARPVNEAIAAMQEMVRLFPNTPNVHWVFGSYLVQGNSDAGIAELKKELEISPDHVAARLMLAFEYLQRGDPAAGLPYAEQAVKLDPGSYAARAAFGRCLLETGKVEESIRQLETAKRLADHSAETRFALATAYSRAGRTADAARERAEFLRLKKTREGADR